jgi:hypothetical protein
VSTAWRSRIASRRGHGGSCWGSCGAIAQGLRHDAGAHRGRLDRSAAPIFEPGSGGSQGNFIPVAKALLAFDPFSIDVRSVETSQIPQHELPAAFFENAVFLRDDFVQKLNRVVRMSTKAVVRSKLDRRLPLGRSQYQPSHLEESPTIPVPMTRGARRGNSGAVVPCCGSCTGGWIHLRRGPTALRSGIGAGR